MHSSPKRDVKFFAKKGGEIFRYEKNEYIFVIWVLKGMSPVNLNKKFEKNVECINGLINEQPQEGGGGLVHFSSFLIAHYKS